MRTPYTAEEDGHLVRYIAEARPQRAGRQGREIYQTLVANLDKWPWAQRHSWQSWREHYKGNMEEFDERIAKYLRKHSTGPQQEGSKFLPTQRAPYTENEDKLLVKYLAKYHPQLKGRNGNQIYIKLTENAEGKWNWSRAHTWQSWRNRYVVNQDRFNRSIERYQERQNIPVPPPPSQDERRVKRQKVMEDDSQEHEWAKLDWTLQKDHARNGSTSRCDEQKEISPVVAERKQPVVVEEPNLNKPSIGSTTADEDQAGTSDDEGKPPGSEDYNAEIFQESDADEKMDQQVSAAEDGDQEDEGEDEDENSQDTDQETVHLNGSTSTAHDKSPTKNQPNIPVSPTPKPIIKLEPVSPHSPPKPSQPKPRPPARHHDSAFGSQYRYYQPQPDDDPFEDSQSPPKNEHKIKLVEKSPPKLVEGPFGNRLSRTRVKKLEDSSTESDGDIDVPWPPPRGETSKIRINGTVAQAREPRGGYPNEEVAGPRQDKGKGKARAYDESDLSPGAPHPIPSVPPVTEPDSRHVEPALSPKAMAFEGHPLTGQIIPLKRRRTDIFLRPTPLDAPTPKRHSTGDITCHPRTHQPAGFTDINHPFNPRIINFRRELNNKPLHQPTHRASSRASHTSSLISEEDNQIFQQLGVQQAIRMLSEQFGFTEAIVQRLWDQLKSLRLLKDALTEMRDSADRTMNEWIEGASRIEDGQSPPRSVLQATPGSMVNGSQASSNRRRRQSSIGTGMKSLEIKPVDIQDASVAMDLEYEPLTGTRAGKYARLVKMGREDEALQREQRRVSSIALSPRRDLLQQQQDQQDAEREGTEKEIVSEAHDEDEGAQDDAVSSAHLDEDADERRPDDQSDEEEEYAMEVDSTPPEVREQHPTIYRHSVERDQVRECAPGPEDRNGVLAVHEERHKNNEPQSLVEDLDGHDQTIDKTTDSPGISEEMSIQTDDERWKEVEPLFRAANKKNVQVLRELERTFNPGFLIGWLGNQVALK